MAGFRVRFVLRAACLAVVLAWSPIAAASVIYVDDDAAGANNGSSWTDAYIYLQEALADANSAEKPVEIRVAQGIYKTNQGLVAIPEFDWRTATFQLISGVTLKGGYAGIAVQDPNAHNIELYETILSGDLNGDDVEVADIKNLLAEPTRADNSYHVVTGSGADDTAVLDGVMITGGTADGPSPYDRGAGIYSDSGSPTLNNCMIRGNAAAYEGGGMYSFEGGVTLNNCTFIGNFAVDGGGLNASSHSALTNCIVWGNSSPQLAGEAVVSYCNVQGGWPGEGNIDADPLFADADSGDYHLKSQAGRWNPVGRNWVIDNVTSPCIDAGNPNTPVAAEPYPNGGIINMGAYGGTAQAGKSPSGLHSKYGGGSGDPNTPYLIYTAEQMNTIGLYEEDWDKHFMLMADINLAAYTGTEFNLIGRYTPWQVDKPFSGTFNGNGHTISNFTYSAVDVSDIAIFKYVGGMEATIKDLGLIDPYVYVLGQEVAPGNIDDPDIDPNDPRYIGTGDKVASLVSYFRSGTVSGCYVKGGRILGRDSIGGLVAYNEGLIIDCDSDTEVTGGGEVGGLAGYNIDKIVGCRSFSEVSANTNAGGLVGCDIGVILDSYSAGRVVGVTSVGGLVGVDYGSVSWCASDSDVIGVNKKIGGLIGSSSGDVNDCRATGFVSGLASVGGPVGLSRGTIIRSYATSDVFCKEIDSNAVGGLVGDNDGVIVSCYSAGSVFADVDAGGLVGFNSNTIKNCYSTADVNGYVRVGGLAGQNKSGTIMNCYTAGSVTEEAGDTWGGGLVGWDRVNSVVASFWDIEITGQAASQGGTGKTTAQMRSADTFLGAGWDFAGETDNGTEDIWRIEEGLDYPHLTWEPIETSPAIAAEN